MRQDPLSLSRPSSRADPPEPKLSPQFKPSPQFKLLPRSLSQIAPDGRFEGYASLFRVPDLGQDVVEPGAFAESLARRGCGGIKLLWQHDPAEPIGRWLHLAEDERGLFVQGQLSLGVARARDIHALMRDGAVDGLSIGFRTQRQRSDPRLGLRRLLRIDLWEISVVTFPMLPQARISAVKRASVTQASELRI
jgi:hypothetical protein